MCAKQTIQTCEMKRGKIDVFHVSLDSETATYFPGQKVSGILHVNVLKAIKIRGMSDLIIVTLSFKLPLILNDMLLSFRYTRPIFRIELCEQFKKSSSS